jgi:hypothetical protein
MRGVDPDPSAPFPGRTIRDSGGREEKPQVALVWRQRRRRLQPPLPVFFLHRRPERGFTERIASTFLYSPGFPIWPSPAVVFLLFPRSAPPQISVPSGNNYGRQVHLLHFSLPISPAWFF